MAHFVNNIELATQGLGDVRDAAVKGLGSELKHWWAMWSE